MKTFIVLLFTAFSIQFGIAQTYSGNQEDIDKILHNIETFSSHVNTSNYKMIGAAYTEDAKIFPQRGDIIASRESIIKYWILPEGVKTMNHKITPVEITIVDDTAYDHGYYEGTTLKANGDKSSWKGKYVIVWKRVGDDWKIYLDIWNSI
ncbi:nuclear transport factor 2 family protein [uncultured Kordia sp.]|uniref:YybH family protein n=1 Tax=uncultured Kordia sp. TaxID=507699 RepID=UPI002635E838|nr:nuclear transport factor 2 family protein [uncultured Kordia sp.]